MTRMLLLLPGETYRATDFVRAASALAGELELDLVVGSDAEGALSALRPGRFLKLDFSDPARAARQVAAFADSAPGRDLDHVVAVDDGGTLVAAHAAARLGLPGNPVAAVAATRDKSLLRERLEAAGIPSPPWWRLREGDDPAALGPQIRFPCVVKPLSLSGSRGVIRADDPEAFGLAVARVRRLLGRPEVAEECGASTDLLVEGYIPGREIAIEGLLEPDAAGTARLRVLAIFDKPDPLEGPFFEETIYVTPSRLTAPEQRFAVDVAERAARALGLGRGPVHAELRLNERGAWPVDLAARSIGGLCARSLRFAPRQAGEEGAGISLEELLLRDAVGGGGATAGYARESAAAGVMMIPIPAPGILRSVSGVAAAESVPGITGLSLDAARGRRLVPLPEGGEYLGFLFARAGTPEAVEEALRRAHAALRFEVEAGAGEAG